MATDARDEQDGRAGHDDPVERVTVVIPARNEVGCLADALASVVAQDYPIDRIECVVVDNGSTDGTAQVAEAFSAAHQELALRLVAEPRMGWVTTRAPHLRAASPVPSVEPLSTTRTSTS